MRRFPALVLLLAAGPAFGSDGPTYQGVGLEITTTITPPAACGETGFVEVRARANHEVDVLVLVDSSSTVDAAEWASIKASLHDFAAGLDLGEDATRFGLISFGRGPALMFSGAFTTDPLEAQLGIEHLSWLGGHTDTTAAVETAVDMFDRYSRPYAHRVVVMVTDGMAALGDDVCDDEPNWLASRDITTWLLRVPSTASSVDSEKMTCLAFDTSHDAEFASFDDLVWPDVEDLSFLFANILTFAPGLVPGELAADAGSAYPIRDGQSVFWAYSGYRGEGTPWSADGATLTIPFTQAPGGPGGPGTPVLQGWSLLTYANDWPTEGPLDALAADLPSCVVDDDGDGVSDDDDVCPDGDDRLDADDDGAPDACDTCPADPFNDSDGDLSCDGADPCPLDPADDADGDGACADVDLCPLDALDDLDGDGACADADRCPLDPANDADGDGICGNDDACAAGDDRLDADGDGAADACDTCPLDAANDADGDGACADADLCPLDALDDLDGDGVCADEDPCPSDRWDDLDGDAVCDSDDPCPEDAANDADGDGVCERDDNCATVANTNQADQDGDGWGDLCEPDNDGDGVIDDTDNCPLDANASQADADGDGRGDTCDADRDGDGVADAADTCLGTPVGAPVLPNGCSLDQEVPCSGPWKNHGAYVSAYTRAAGQLVSTGKITSAQRDALVRAAAGGSCGRR